MPINPIDGLWKFEYKDGHDHRTLEILAGQTMSAEDWVVTSMQHDELSSADGWSELVKTVEPLYQDILRSRPLCGIIDSGSLGPGPTYKTLDLYLELREKNYCGDLSLYCTSPGQQQYIQEHIATWKAKNIGKYPKLASVNFEVKVLSPDSLANVRPPVPLLLFSGFVGSAETTSLRIGKCPLGTAWLGANGVFGNIPFVYYRDRSQWHKLEVQRCLPRPLVSEQVAAPAASAGPKPVILNNPFNWDDQGKRPGEKLSTILATLQALATDPHHAITIVPKFATEITALEQLVEKAGVAAKIVKPTFALKETLAPGMLVITEGVGLLEDCLKIPGITALQVLKPLSGVADIYTDLTYTSEQYREMAKLQQVFDVSADPAVRQQILSALLSPEHATKIHPGVSFFLEAWQSYRTKLMQKDSTIRTQLLMTSAALVGADPSLEQEHHMAAAVTQQSKSLFSRLAKKWPWS